MTTLPLLLMTVGCMDTLLPALPFETSSNHVALGSMDLDNLKAFRDFEARYSMEPDLAGSYERSQLMLEYEVINTAAYEGLVTLWVLPEDWDGGIIPNEGLMGSVVEIPATPAGVTPEHRVEQLFIAASPPDDVMHVVLTLEGSADLVGTASIHVRVWYPDAVDDPWLELEVLSD